ncbi:MAG: hypothetical protein IPL53_19340 [Ignavibacteria bacterium]|nr:hypothetical protein [Ignavibacteria bacterium]
MTESENEIDKHIIADTLNIDNEIVVTEVPRKLISDDLIKLHKEITKEEENEPSKTNLWG